MANIIRFKYVDERFGNQLGGLIAHTSIQVAATRSIPCDPRQEECLRNAPSAVYLSPIGNAIVNDYTTDIGGFIEVDVESIYPTSSFQNLWNKYGNLKGFNISFTITLTTDKQEIDSTVYVGSANVAVDLYYWNVVFNPKIDMYEFPTINYDEESDYFYIAQVAIDKDILYSAQARKSATEREYVDSQKDYHSNLISQSILQIPVFYEYNPINFNQVITRSLELSNGVLVNGLSYATDAGLNTERLRLQGIKNKIQSLSSLYPDLTLELGEGQPYQNIGVIPRPFNSFSFFRYGGVIFFGYQFTFDPYVDAQQMKDNKFKLNITLNGLSMYYKDVPSNQLNVDVSELIQDLINQSLITGLNPGDILMAELDTLDGNLYDSTIIIK